VAFDQSTIKYGYYIDRLSGLFTVVDGQISDYLGSINDYATNGNIDLTLNINHGNNTTHFSLAYGNDFYLNDYTFEDYHQYYYIKWVAPSPGLVPPSIYTPVIRSFELIPPKC
ncbi:hypothetical protein, partial [Klebsiella pneumoniae]|uniref:hypothetical protein n=1 Tax=Klebsiella pneumoniae TaxID=573 RepID=UPI003852A9FE